jgi:hypothetical protein
MTELRKCIGSTRFGIEAHEAPVEDFPVQPSQKDGLGRMCKVHWNQYTTSLAREAKSRKAATTEADAPDPDTVETTPQPVETKPRRTKGKAAAPVAGSTEAGAE